MPFYRQIASERAAKNGGVSLLVLSRDDDTSMSALLSKEHVGIDGIVHAPPVPQLRGTPTLLLVDSAGIVRRVFEGQLAHDDEQVVLAMIRKTRVAGS